MNTETNKQTL